jgi:hypothetical protein
VSDPALDELLAHSDDATIALAIRGVKDLERRWLALPPGGKLTLSWPLPRDAFAGAAGEDPSGGEDRNFIEPHRQTERTSGLVAGVLAKDVPGHCGSGWDLRSTTESQHPRGGR